MSPQTFITSITVGGYINWPCTFQVFHTHVLIQMLYLSFSVIRHCHKAHCMECTTQIKFWLIEGSAPPWLTDTGVVTHPVWLEVFSGLCGCIQTELDWHLPRFQVSFAAAVRSEHLHQSYCHMSLGDLMYFLAWPRPASTGADLHSDGVIENTCRGVHWP